MRTFHFKRRNHAVPHFVFRSSVANSLLWALCLTAGSVQANPLMILGGINGVVDAVKRTSNSVAAATQQTAPGPAKPRITLPGAHQIQRGMRREAVIALVGVPAQTQRAGMGGVDVRDVYKVKREGSCGLDQVEVIYGPDDGAIREIVQRCGDVTSGENRYVRYSFQLELPEVFDKLALKMSRDQVMAVLGAPQDTRAAGSSTMFVDVYAFGIETAELQYDKRQKLLDEVKWNGRDVQVPRIRRSDVFEQVSGS